MKFRALFAAAVSAALVFGMVLPLPGTERAEAVTLPDETGLAFVTNQDAGANCTVNPTSTRDQHVLVAEPLTGDLKFDYGKPSNVSGVLNDAKPIENHHKVVAVWGGQDANRDGGFGIYTRATDSWQAFPLPDGFADGDGAAHSITVLQKDGSFAIAQTGGTDTAWLWGYIVIFDKLGVKKSQTHLKGVHGIEWDASRGFLFAIGDDHVKKYTYDRTDFSLDERDSWQLPLASPTATKRLGHDLSRRRTVSNDYLLSTNDEAWVFDPEIPGSSGTAAFSKLRRQDNSTLGGGVKSLDERFDGIIEHSAWKDPTFYFLHRGPESATFCMKGYKVRWLYDAGDPLYREDAPSQSTPTAEPFIWEKKTVTGSGSPIATGGQVWLGGGTNDTVESAATKVRNAMAQSSTAEPYFKFYQWGDSGSPKMGGVDEASIETLRVWKTYASRMAQEIGKERKATIVIEPEWDTNMAASCDNEYRQVLREVIGIFKTQSPKVRLMNGIGMWTGNDADYDCFRSTDPARFPDGPNLHKLFDDHGFLLHVVNSQEWCRKRTDGNSNGPYYIGGTDEAGAIAKVDSIDDKAERIKRLFGDSTAYVSDMAVTRCGWGDDGQARIIARLVDQLTTLYSKNGLRGVSFRSNGPPSKAERYLGVENEGQFNYAGFPGGVEIDRGTTVMQNYLASIAGAPSTPTFSAGAEASPAKVPVGDPTTIQVTATNTGGTLSNGVVELEIYNPSGGLHQLQPWTGQTFANTETRTNSFTWTAPATTGSYTFKVAVLSSDRSVTYHHSASSVGSVFVGASEPSFSSSVVASPADPAPGAAVELTATITNTGGDLTNGIVDIEVRNADGSQNNQQWEDAQTIPAGATRTYTMPWTAPQSAGTFGVSVGVFGAGWTPLYDWDNDAGSVNVASSRFTSSATVSRATVAPNGTTTITATVTNTGTDLVDGIVDLEVYDSIDSQVGQQASTAQTIPAGASRTYTWTWTAPATPGTYSVKVGVFTSGWTTTLHWNGRAAAVNVLAYTFSATGTAEPATVAPGVATSLTATVTPTGGSLDGAVVDIEVYNATGTRVGQLSWSNQALEHGVARSFTGSWTAPAATGSYTVKVGVFGPGWTPTYKWVDNADKVTVANPAFTSSADVSASSVASGGVVTITPSFTNSGGEMAAGNVDLEIFNAAGVRVTQKTWTGEAIGHGQTKSYSYNWTAPATPGTYTVKLGVMDADWSPTWHWNNGAATVSVGSSSFLPSFSVANGANTWWIEVYTSNDVTAVDVLGDDGGFYLSLTKKSWGAWAATAPSQLAAGDLVRFIARRSSDGATAGSSNFVWLSASPTTEPGWACTFTIGAGANANWVEVYTSTTATAVEVKIGTGAFTALTKQGSGAWAKAMSVPAGSKVVFRATKTGGARAYSTFSNWLT